MQTLCFSYQEKTGYERTHENGHLSSKFTTRGQHRASDCFSDSEYKSFLLLVLCKMKIFL